ncbi:MAG TPA: hypothetical protein V6D47_03920 [Oscillatoriaceae cyanobacterium]
MSEEIQLYSTVTAEPLLEAAQILEQCAKEQQAAMVDLGQGLYYLGWHPLLGRFTIAHRAEDAPAALPRFRAMLEEARHVHAGADSPEQAVAALAELFIQTAKHLQE